MNDPKIKQQIVEKIKDSSNILVTVSNSPSVDELAAALGLTLMLNKMEKHATAVVSGDIPPAITFLDPEKTFENTTDSLRDFIIALDKEKADHLRYKLDGDVVKIFITPYRTTITSDDLEFSQGDYNVELVLALGVENQEHLDAALESHGRILHDATVATISAGEQVSNLGSLDWRDENASSLSEMLVSLSEAIRSDKTLLDKTIATALLTGIVASTDRFSNTRTSSRVMTMAAQLMAAGADQQLIATKLEESHEIGDTTPAKQNDNDGRLNEGELTKLPKQPEEPEPPKKDDGSLQIEHEKRGTLEEVAQEVQQERQEAASRAAERALEKQAEERAAQEAADAAAQPAPAPQKQGAVDWKPQAPPVQEMPEPSFGGTLNATTEQAGDDKRREIEKDKNRTILSHGYLGGAPTYDQPINGSSQGAEQEKPIDPFAETVPQSAADTTEPTARAQAIQPPSEASQPSAPGGPASFAVPSPFSNPPQANTIPQAPAPDTQPEAPTLPPIPAPSTNGPTLAQIDAENRAQHDDARAAVEAALAASPDTTAQAPQTPPQAPPMPQTPNELPPMPPPLPDFSSLPPAPTPQAPGAQPQILGDILAPENSQLPPANGMSLPPSPFQSEPQQPQTSPQAPPVSNDPGQFKIPGQS